MYLSRPFSFLEMAFECICESIYHTNIKKISGPKGTDLELFSIRFEKIFSIYL